MKKEHDGELAKLREELKGKSSKLEQRGSELNSVQEQIGEARRLAEDTQAKRDHEKEAFQMEREGLLRDVEQARAGKVETQRKIIEFRGGNLRIQTCEIRARLY